MLTPFTILNIKDAAIPKPKAPVVDFQSISRPVHIRGYKQPVLPDLAKKGVILPLYIPFGNVRFHSMGFISLAEPFLTSKATKEYSTDFRSSMNGSGLNPYLSSPAFQCTFAGKVKKYSESI